MKWKKLGSIYQPKRDLNHPKLITHAANPLPVHLHDDVYRVYFNGRDNKNRSSVGAIDFDIKKKSYLKISMSPYLSMGQRIAFFHTV